MPLVTRIWRRVSRSELQQKDLIGGEYSLGKAGMIVNILGLLYLAFSKPQSSKCRFKICTNLCSLHYLQFPIDISGQLGRHELHFCSCWRMHRNCTRDVVYDWQEAVYGTGNRNDPGPGGARAARKGSRLLKWGRCWQT